MCNKIKFGVYTLAIWLFAYTANAAICYLESGDCSEDTQIGEVSRCSYAQGYYSADSLPAGYDCVEVKDGCVGLYKCEKNRCLQAGYAPVEANLGFDFAAWDCDSCVDKGVIYRKCKPKPCERGYSTEVSARSCSAGTFYKSHNSGNMVCGKCVEPDGNTCEIGVSKIPSGCYSCKANGKYDLEGHACLDCKVMAGYTTEHSNNCAKGWNKAVAADGSVCYKATGYKTREEAGCHRSYDAAKCTCSGAADGCPEGYYASVKSCPQGYSFVSKDGCGTCMTVSNCPRAEAVNAANRAGSAAGKDLSNANIFKAKIMKNNKNAAKSDYVNVNGDHCREICKPLDDKGNSFCVISCNAPYLTTKVQIGAKRQDAEKCGKPQNIYLQKPVKFSNIN